MQFAKLFEYGEHQLLIKKTFGDEEEPGVECITTVEGLQITNTLGFKDTNKRDEAFDSMTQESCTVLFNMMDDLSKGKTPWQ